MIQQRSEGRAFEQPRPIKITPNYTLHAEGSVLVETGNTKVLCNASVEDGVPSFLRGTAQGWVTAEYSMLPRATLTRIKRERSKVGGRTQEIQRLIGRALRAGVDFQALGERTIWIDCDVLQADGGTRTAAITGGYVAMYLAAKHVEKKIGGFAGVFPIRQQIAAISLGILEGTPLLDLDYSEDSRADVDMNIIMNSDFQMIEIQGTAEKKTFDKKELFRMLEMAEQGLQKHFEEQRKALGIR